MNTSLLPYIICPSCRADQWKVHTLTREDSVLVCNRCTTWYISEEGILELLPEDLNLERKKLFYHKHEKQLKRLRLSLSKKILSPPAGTQQKKSQMHFFNEFSSDYVLETHSFWKAYYSLFFDITLPHVQKGSFILDVGCGTGLGSIPFLTKDYTLIGIDLSREMLKKAIDRIPSSLRKRHHFLVADAENLPFKKETFDVCIGLGIFHHVHSIHAMAVSVASCLKHGGFYFGHENNKTFFRPFFDFLMRIYTLWHEEAGEEQLLSQKDLIRLFPRYTLRTTTHVFLPPHFFNWFSVSTAKKLLLRSDTFFSKIPGLKNQGGTLIFAAQKH